MRKVVFFLVPCVNAILQYLSNNYSNCSTSDTNNTDCASTSTDTLSLHLYYAEMSLALFGFTMTMVGDCKQNTRWGRALSKLGFVAAGAGLFGVAGTALGAQSIAPQNVSTPITMTLGAIAGCWTNKRCYPQAAAVAPLGAAPAGCRIC